MTLEQLRIFVAVAEREHVTRAAAALNLTQSAVSAAVSGLEAENGLALFNRVGRRIELTEAGRLFLREAKAVLQQAEGARRVLQELAGLTRGTLRLRASQTIASYWLPPLLVRFQRLHPAIALSVGIGNSRQVAQSVAAGEVELGFVEGEVEGAGLLQRRVADDDLLLVVGAAHPLARSRSVTPADLLGYDWILREPGSGTRSEFEAALGKLGLDAAALRVVLELPSNEAVRTAVEAGGGAAALSVAVAAAGLEQGRLARLPLALPLPRPFSLLRHAERPPGPAARAFLELLDGARGLSSAAAES